MTDVSALAEAESVAESWRNPLLAEADVIVIDHDAPEAFEFIQDACERLGAHVIVYSIGCDEDRVLQAISSGAVGCLRKDTLTPDSLATAVRAAATGAGVMAPDLLSALASGSAASAKESEGSRASLLTTREQRVLTLVANGCPTREVAQELCYSERTVKNVIHDVVTKLNARTRSQAVAHAVRHGLI